MTDMSVKFQVTSYELQVTSWTTSCGNCQARGIAYESYSPFGRGGKYAPLNMSDPRIVRIAEAHGRSAYQVCMHPPSRLL